jgi:HTH-type transcriptional regulator, sugar sensing transcriptional regulator
VIIDEATVMFGMQDPVAGAGEDLTIMVVEHPSLAQTLKLAFNRVWDRGLEFDAAMERRKAQLARSA